MFNVVKEIFEILLTAIFGLGLPASKAMIEFRGQVEDFLQFFKINEAYTICIIVFSSLIVLVKFLRKILSK